MKIADRHYHTIWLKENDERVVQIIDQRYLPHQFIIEDLSTVDQVAEAIKEMHVRGAPLIGATAAFGIYIAALNAPKGDFDQYLSSAAQQLKRTRPTAVNLCWAVDRLLQEMSKSDSQKAKIATALHCALQLKAEEIEFSRRIGEFGAQLIAEISHKKKGARVNILTHCNAGWLACLDWGTATAPIYVAKERGIDLHVWVDETRPLNQGARITAWELGQNGVDHTVIVDNCGGHLMQHGMVDLVITGTDRTTFTGDVANKIGTYLKALAAHDNQIPFYVALTSSAFDWQMRDGVAEIPIETRDPEEVREIAGWCKGKRETVLLTPESSPAVNYGFDVTPARLVTGLITERGLCAASEAGILALFPEKRR